MKNTATKALIDNERFASVSKDKFFAVVGPMNVHPRIEGRYDQTYGYLSLWETQDAMRRVVGKTIGGTTFSQDEYQLAREFTGC